MSRKFWNWVRNDNEDRILVLNGEISNEQPGNMSTGFLKSF